MQSAWDLYICTVHSLGILLQSSFSVVLWTKHPYNEYVSELTEGPIVGWDSYIPLKGWSTFGVHL